MQGREALLKLLILAGLSAIAALILFPKAELSLEAELASLPPAESFSQLETMKGQLSPYLAFRHAELTAATGNVERSDALLASLAGQTGDSSAISTARADLALRSNNLVAAVEHLQQAHVLEADPLLRQRLGLLYRRLGDSEKEKSLLETVQFADLTGPERLRRVDLTAANGAITEAISLARAAVQMGGTDAPEQAKRFAALALSTGAINEFATTTADWLSGPNAQTLALHIATILTTIPQESGSIASEMVATAPETRALVVSTLSRVELFGAARVLIDPWTVSGPPDSESWDAFALYADLSGDVSLLETILRHPEAPSDLSLQYLLPLVRYGGGQALLPYRNWFSDDRLATAPLVDAAWSIWRQSPNDAYEALLRAAKSETDRTLWLAIASDLEGTVYFARLQALSRRDAKISAMFER